MAQKAFVTGRTQNRTALGIIAAYLKMYPNTTLSELKRTFAKAEVCPDGEWFQRDQACCTQDGEWLNVKGTKVAFCKMWTAPSLAKLQKKAESYGISAQVGDIAKSDNNYKVGYTITYEGGKKGIPFWVWLLLALLILGAAAFFFLSNKEEEKPAAVVQPKVEEVQTVVETKVNEIKEHFNAAEFEKKKAELSETSKAVLMDLVKLLNENPSVKLQLEGHTSAEGDDNFNKKLSTSRAKAAVDFLVANGIDSSRLSYSGLGSSQLKNTANPEADENRRVEFIVIK